MCLMALSSIQSINAQTLTTRNMTGENDELVISILELALSKSDPSIKLKSAIEPYTDMRLLNEVNDGNVDVTWSGPSDATEEKMLTVRLPILKGLLGHRLFIIKRDQQHKFSQVKTYEDLKQLSAGQGRFWGDVQILESAGITVKKTIKYENLFKMLEGERFDYFPRGIHEPWPEVKNRPELDLVVEKKIMLVYPFAMHFFVAKDNQELHDKIYDGLQTAMLDGSYDRLFFKDKLVKKLLNLSDIPNRLVFRIDNPFIHPDTPVDIKEYWLNIDTLKMTN